MTSPKPAPVHERRHRTNPAIVVVIVVLLVVGAVALTLGVRGTAGPPRPNDTRSAPAAAPPRSAPTVTTPASRTPSTPPASTAVAAPKVTFGQFLNASAPTGIDIPSIGLHSNAFVGLRVGADGTLTPPATAQQVGWWTAGPTPGQIGPAVIGAHVDSKAGPGVFYRLGAVKKGDLFTVSRQDGSALTFLVDKVALYPKDAFPTEEVYRGTFNRSEIRLITCGGTFDPAKHYLDNVVVFGHLDRAT